MRGPEFYLGETEFTKKDEDTIKSIAEQRTNIDTINDYIHFLYSETKKRFPNEIPKEVKEKLWRKRSAEEIVIDKFLTGCTDACLVFVTLARTHGIPATYVETIEEDFLKNPTDIVQGHIFSDIYQNGRWVHYNPGYGKTIKQDNFYLWSPNEPTKRYKEVSRGLDFSQLYSNDIDKPIELKRIEQIRKLVKS